MGYRQSNEGNRSAEGGGDGRQDACHNKQPVARANDVHPQILGILITQHQGIEGFDEQHRAHQSGYRHRSKDGHRLHRHPTERAHPPNHIGLYALVSSKEVEQ